MKLLQEKTNNYLLQRTLLLNSGLENYLTAQSKISYSKPCSNTVYSKNGATLHSRAHTGTPILLIPSHINKSYILDLLLTNSFLQQLEDVGLHPYLLEWNQPTTENNDYDLNDYICKTLIPIIEHLYQKHGSKIILLGYCMGGLCATAAAQLASEMVAGLITIATPWNFHAMSFPYKITENIYPIILNMNKDIVITKEIINIIMQWPHINSVVDKFIMLATQQEISSLFIAVENWLDDGLDMTKPLFATCVEKLLLHNEPYNSQWHIDGIKIAPSIIKQPFLCIVGKNDKISSPECALPLAKLFSNSQSLILDTGHLGIIVSTKINTARHIGKWAEMLQVY